MSWIAVKDELPKYEDANKDFAVWVYFKNENEKGQTFSTYDYIFKQFWATNADYEIEDITKFVTHWYPLPKEKPDSKE